MLDERIETTAAGAATVDPEGQGDKFDSKNFDFQDAGVNFTGVTQPKWKWSFDGKHLTMWEVDALHGQPHHIEVTGMNFWKLAQGRVYVDPDGFMEILVWSDRGTHQMQDDAINAVDDWLSAHVGRIADDVTFQTEGGYYQTITPKSGPDMDQLMSTYFGYPVSIKDNQIVKKEQDLNDELLDRVNREANDGNAADA